MEKRLWFHPVIMNHHVPPCDPVSFCFPSLASTNLDWIWVCLKIRVPKFIQLGFLFNETSSKLVYLERSQFRRQISRVPTFRCHFLGLTLQCVVPQQLQKHRLAWQRTHSKNSGALVFFGRCGKATLTLASQNIRTILCMENKRSPLSCLWMLDLLRNLCLILSLPVPLALECVVRLDKPISWLSFSMVAVPGTKPRWNMAPVIFSPGCCEFPSLIVKCIDNTVKLRTRWRSCQQKTSDHTRGYSYWMESKSSIEQM